MLYTFTTYMQKYLVNTAGSAANVANGITDGCAVILFSCWYGRYSALSDKDWQAHLYAMFWRTFATLFTVPILSALQSVTSPYAAFAFSDVRAVIV